MTQDANEQPQTDPGIDSNSAREAYEALLPTWKKRAENEILRPRTSVFDSVELGLKLAKQAQRDRELFTKQLPMLDVQYLDGLREASLGLWTAETRWRTTRRRANQDEIDKIVVKSLDLRKELLAGADYIWRKDDKVIRLLRDIREGSGHRDLADDLQRLADLFHTRWKEAEGRSDVTETQVNDAAKLATTLLEEVIQGDQAEALDLRNRAWSHWYESYVEVYAGGRYIHRHHPNAASLYPSLNSLSERGARTESKDQKDAPGEGEQTEPTSSATTPGEQTKATPTTPGEQTEPTSATTAGEGASEPN